MTDNTPFISEKRTEYFRKLSFADLSDLIIFAGHRLRYGIWPGVIVENGKDRQIYLGLRDGGPFMKKRDGCFLELTPENTINHEEPVSYFSGTGNVVGYISPSRLREIVRKLD